MYTVLVGLKGMQIEKEAKHILELLGKLQKDFTRVDTEFGKVGAHLEQALHRHEDAEKIFARLKGKVEGLSTGSQAEVLDSGEEIKQEEQ
jgi:DNA anti-recombination protein RmuC